MLLNANEIVHTQKDIYEYKEKINAKIQKYATYDTWGKKKEWELGLENDQKAEVSFIRDLKNNAWTIEMKMPRAAYDTPLPPGRTVKLNDRILKVDEAEQIEPEVKKLKISRYNDDNSLIKFDDLKKFEVHFRSIWSRATINKLAFQINFELEKNLLDLKELNVRKKNLKLDFIESINFVITKDTSTEYDPFENNSAFTSNLVYDLNFFNLKQNDFFYKVMEQKVELKSQNKYFLPKREFTYDFFNKIHIGEEENSPLELNLKRAITNVDQFRYKIDYYIDRKNQWNKEEKKFIESEEGQLQGYHLPVKFNGDIKIKYQSSYNIIDSSQTINYRDTFANKIFDSKEGLIKLNTEVIKVNEKTLTKDFENWKTIIL
ncbi:Hypothetical protein MAU_4810 [Metamycoplasma auris 15026]|uniref:Uncharacterized protein n=1 Tax=Metamycoplasma auris 15026 TaxID=1188233 RepID=N9TRK0_9BACT|nr:hypothetical protein [Metamycoplasma auris]ENY68685.1 Hypothetical protein MAU_4810 [Metamycoplasma auris 15026]